MICFLSIFNSHVRKYRKSYCTTPGVGIGVSVGVGVGVSVGSGGVNINVKVLRQSF